MTYIFNKNKHRLKKGDRVIINELAYICVERCNRTRYKFVLSDYYYDYKNDLMESYKIGVNHQIKTKWIIKDIRELNGKEVY